jgi:hypothetical protein
MSNVQRPRTLLTFLIFYFHFCQNPYLISLASLPNFDPYKGISLTLSLHNSEYPFGIGYRSSLSSDN